MPRRVVIVGGGFAGLFAARALTGCDAEVVIVDRTTHHLFQPLLYQVATGVLSEGQVAVPLRTVLRRHDNVDSLLAEAVSVDVGRRTVLAERPDGAKVEVPYDDLIFAAGMKQSYFGHDEFAAHAPGMKTLGDALEIRERVFGAFEMAQVASDADERRQWLTFALVGAGPTGVELAGQIRELATHTLENEYQRFDPGDARVLLFDGGDEPLAPFGPKLSGKAADALHALGVETHMHSVVTDVDGRGLVVRDGAGELTRYDARTVLWTAGVAAPAVADALAGSSGAEQDRAGRIKVSPQLTIPGHPEISVVGDVMSLDRLPGVAEVAMQSGFYAARRIRADIQGTPMTKPFTYHDLGSAAYISRGSAVMSFGPLHASGRLGWLAWLVIHITFLTGYRNRLGALLTWAVTFSKETRRERAFSVRAVPAEHDVFGGNASD
jgi:NADH:ubiquinone reductase (H+-translocating)